MRTVNETVLTRTRDAAPLFRGEDLGSILCDLERCEDESGLFGTGKRKAKGVFVASSSVAVIGTQPRWKLWARVIAGVQPPQRDGVAASRTSSRAHRIRVKNNVLAFYPDRRLVCKFWRRSGVRSRDSLQHEVAAIRAVGGSVRVPSIVLDRTQPEHGGIPAIWMVQIEGKAPTGNGAQGTASVLRWLEMMLPWYDKHGVALVEPAGAFTCEDLTSYGWSVEESKFLAGIMSRVATCGGTMPVAWIHGDASLGNCLIDKKGDMTILDWERSRRAYVAEDISKLARYGEAAVKERFARWMGEHSWGDNGVLSADTQLDIVNVRANLDLVGREQYLRMMMSCQQVRERIADTKQQVMAAAERIDTQL